MRCGYQLLGQPLLGACPECGLSVASSLAASMEHVQRALTDLRRPRLVATMLVACAITVLVCIALQMGGPMLSMFESFTGQRSPFPDRIRMWSWSLSAVALLASAALGHAALRPSEPALRREMGRWRFWLLAGMWLWCAAAIAAVLLMRFGSRLPAALLPALPWVGVAIQLPGMAMMLSGYHALLAVLGRRSRTFTEATAARQSVKLLNGTAALLLVLTMASLILENRVVRGPDLRELVSIMSRAGAACLAGLLLFGSAYLVANAWWIGRNLLLPTERVEDIQG